MMILVIFAPFVYNITLSKTGKHINRLYPHTVYVFLICFKFISSWISIFHGVNIYCKKEARIHHKHVQRSSTKLHQASLLISRR